MARAFIWLGKVFLYPVIVISVSHATLSHLAMTHSDHCVLIFYNLHQLELQLIDILVATVMSKGPTFKSQHE